LRAEIKFEHLKSLLVIRLSLEGCGMHVIIGGLSKVVACAHMHACTGTASETQGPTLAKGPPG
jgi:hypothetical protein